MGKNKEDDVSHSQPLDPELTLGTQTLIDDSPRKKKLRGGTLSVMFLTMVSRILGFVRLKVTALYFGASIEADILNYVFAIPNNLRKIFAEGSLTTAFMPEFINKIKDSSKSEHLKTLCHPKGIAITSANKLLISFLSFQGLIIGAFILIAILASYPIMYSISGFRGENLVLASQLFSLIIIYILFVSISSIFSGVLNAHKEFLIPAFSPLLFSLGSIFSIYVWQGTLGIFSVVIGIWLGGILQIMIHYPSLYQLGYRGILTTFSLKNHPSLSLILKRWFPILGISLLTVIAQQIQFSLATLMKEGDVSVLSSAIVFFQLPFGILYASIAVVFFPRMSSFFIDGKKEDFEKTYKEAFELLTLLLLPASFWLFIYADPLLTLFLQGGRFDREATLRTAYLLKVFSSHLLIMGLFSFLLRVFYATSFTKAPFYLALFASIGEVLFAYLTMDYLGVSSIPWGTTFLYSLSLIFGIIALVFSGYSISLRNFLKTVGIVFLSLIPSFLIAYFSLYVWPWDNSFSFIDFGMLSLLGFLSVFSCFGFYFYLKIPSFMGLLKKSK